MKKLIYITIILAVLSIGITVSSKSKAATCTVLSNDNSYNSTRLQVLINNYRKANHLPLLWRYGQYSYLNTFASHKAYVYQQSRVWAHDINGRSWLSIYSDCGYRGGLLGENLARNFGTPEQVMQAWINSYSHRSLLLNPNFRSIGIYYGNRSNDNYVVATFSR